MSHMYTRNDGDGPAIEARDRVQSQSPQAKATGLEEGQIKVVRVAFPPSRTPTSSLFARFRPQSNTQERTPPAPKKTLSLRINHLLGLNPGFCPGAVHLRCQNLQNNLFSSKCTHCGLLIDPKYPSSYTSGYVNYPKLSKEFLLELHVSIHMRDKTERLGYLICWQYAGVWEEPMSKEEWGRHVRRHLRRRGIGRA
jgi:hypothetical protein